MAACAAEAPGSLGQLQNLRFAYTEPVPCSDCGLDREVPVGQVVSLGLYNVNHKVRYQVRSTAPSIAEFHSTPRCLYLDTADCHETISVVARTAGDADLEVFDEWTGTVLDRATVKVRMPEMLATEPAR